MSQSGLNIPNLDKLIAHLEAQPPERINMGYVEVREWPGCGTAGCIVGHARLIWPRRGLEAVGLGSPFQIDGPWDRLVTPPDWEDERKAGHFRYPAHRVIATLKRLRDTYLRTGEIVVDWGPEPGSEPAQPWAAPQACELTPPALPETITRFLAAEPVTTGTEGR